MPIEAGATVRVVGVEGLVDGGESHRGEMAMYGLGPLFVLFVIVMVITKYC